MTPKSHFLCVHSLFWNCFFRYFCGVRLFQWNHNSTATESATAVSPEFFGAFPAPLASDNDEDGSEMGRCDGWERSPGFPVSRSRFWCSGWAGSEASGRLPAEGPSVIGRSDSFWTRGAFQFGLNSSWSKEIDLPYGAGPRTVISEMSGWHTSLSTWSLKICQL